MGKAPQPANFADPARAKTGSRVAFVFFFAILLPVLTISACGGGSGPGASGSLTLTKSVSLEHFDSCAALETYLEQVAIEEMDRQFDIFRATGTIPYGPGMGGEPVFTGGPVPLAFEDTGSGQAAPDGAGAGFSRTNVQVAGVDEADIVKTDGSYIYTLSGEDLVIVDVSRPEEANEVGRLSLSGYPIELFLSGSRVVVFSQPSTSIPGPDPLRDMAPVYFTPPELAIQIVDVSDRTDPNVVSSIRFAGTYVTSRMIDGTAYAILSSYPPGPPIMYPPPGATAPTIEELEETNRSLILETTLSDWIPSFTVTRRDGSGAESTSTETVACDRFYFPSEANGRGTATILAINVNDPGPAPLSTAVVGSPAMAYASKDRLYLAEFPWYHGWPTPIMLAEGTAESPSSDTSLEETTSIHAFALDPDTGPDYLGSGSVPGSVLNQFSMDEYGGYLRVATTTNPDQWWGGRRDETTNGVYVLGLEGGELRTVGALEDLAHGERIYSARFAGDKGFLVTFRQVDPLFTLDLSDPEHPVAAGELKVSGFSTYIHPLDENTLLSIGNETETQGDTTIISGVALSIFDVTDFSHPGLLHREVIGGRGTASQALYDHKAFLYYQPEHLLAVPVSMHPWSDPEGGPSATTEFTGLLVYRVDTAAGFTETGRISHGGLVEPEPAECRDTPLGPSCPVAPYYYSPPVLRSLVVGESLAVLSTEWLTLSPVDDPDVMQSSVRIGKIFPAPVPPAQ